MALRDRIAYLRKEHRELLQVADNIESALALGSKADFSDHQRCLRDLRALGHGLAGIEEHCHAEERAVESIYHLYADRKERRAIDQEHADIARVLADFREELRFATADRTQALQGPGMALVGRLRSHILREERLLREIGKLQPARTARHRRSRTAERRHAPTSQRRNASCNEPSMIPYTMEPHPEL